MPPHCFCRPVQAQFTPKPIIFREATITFCSRIQICNWRLHIPISKQFVKIGFFSRIFHPSMNLSHPSKSNWITLSKFSCTELYQHNSQLNRLTFIQSKHFNALISSNQPIIARCKHQDSSVLSAASDDSNEGKSFWGAVSLIVGTAVGPGMLGLPAATMRSGPFPSTIAILLSWIYVISSILLVAELSFAAMEEDGVGEVSFTGLATKTLGSQFGAFVSIVYACLSFSLLVACVSGIGSIVSQWFPRMNPLVAHALFPSVVGTVIGFFPFKAIDSANRLLCFIMLSSISALVVIGLSIARTGVLSSFSHASWCLSSILPAIPVTVLTLGFHVITPFICKIAGNTVNEARKAILFGGFVPLVMVLVWNVIVLGLSGTRTAFSENPIGLLLSINSSALSAVQGFAFSALATSLIGYAVSFPKQLVDTFELFFGKTNSKETMCSKTQVVSNRQRTGRVGLIHFSVGDDMGNAGTVSFNGSCAAASEAKVISSLSTFDSCKIIVTLLVLGIPVLIASFFPSTFSRALDFAGVYANCFLFGILPPVMTYMYKSRNKLRSIILPGGDGALLLLFSIAVILGIWH